MSYVKLRIMYEFMNSVHYELCEVLIIANRIIDSY